MSIQEAFEICTRLFLLCGIFAPVAMCQGLGWYENPKKKQTARRGKKRRQRPANKTRLVNGLTRKPKGAYVAPPLSAFEQALYTDYIIKRNRVA